ncbi:hypothetical protein E4U57_001064 [Claviceps arundinis]|uniref:2EXR domain-containing protein n=1 Tax=Claviceps arundinis TaxID=1623583 RepID=A0ABQ7PBE6_9HYPO|nr:hypothetical protein E4U57_001064 [Claviceps arundinis]
MFPLFSSLVPELRQNIWRLALPDNIGRPLHFYQEHGYWRERELEEYESAYRPGYKDKEIEFRTELIDPEVQLSLPQFFVNHEAHDITAAWLRQQGGGFVLYPGQTNEMDRFIRPFNAERDTLYIPQDKWSQFLSEPGDNDMGNVPREQSEVTDVTVVNPKLIRFALPEAVFWDPEMLELLPQLPGHRQVWYDDPAKFFVIMGVQPEQISPTEQDSWSWEMKGTEMGALVWDKTKQEFVFEQGAETLDEEHVALFARIEEAARVNLREGMIEFVCHTLEIRLAYAVRRQRQ